MKKISHIESRPSNRFDEFDPAQEGNKNTKFADVIIDGRSLYQMFRNYDMVPSLGWGNVGNQRQVIDYFLMKEMYKNLYYRYPILVCPWCGDEECGFISVRVYREDGIVIWEDFKLEPDNKLIDIGPFYFKWDNYEAIIRNTFGIAGIQ